VWISEGAVSNQRLKRLLIDTPIPLKIEWIAFNRLICFGNLVHLPIQINIQRIIIFNNVFSLSEKHYFYKNILDVECNYGV